MTRVYIPATLATLLGVTTPESEYTLGHDLFGPIVRERCVSSAWDEMALVDARTKLVVPFRDGKLAGSTITTAEVFRPSTIFVNQTSPPAMLSKSDDTKMGRSFENAR